MPNVSKTSSQSRVTFDPTAGAGFARSTLREALSADDEDILVSNTNDFPPDGGIIVLNRLDRQPGTFTMIEYAHYTYVSGDRLVGVTRGIDGSRAISHPVGTSVEYFEQFKKIIIRNESERLQDYLKERL